MTNRLKAAKRWNIPIEIAEAVIQRDKRCIYCGCEFDDTIRSKKASWEHIVNDIRLNGLDNIALCCVGCNASKGTKRLDEWIVSEKARKRGATWPKHI